MSDRVRVAGRHDRELPPELRRAVAAWRAVDRTGGDVSDLAPAVLHRLRAARPAPAAAPARPRWGQFAAALCAAGLLVAAGVALVPAGGEPAERFAAAPVPEPAPEPAVVVVPAAPPELAAVGPEPAEVVPPATEPVRPAFPTDLLVGRLSAPRAWLSPDRLADAWAAVPASRPGRTWRDEVRDGVRPLRAGVSTAVGLFARAVPPPPRSM